ncbi:hypothetical protein [Ktedonobacter robiniae]|uniref:Methionyl/Valyl/Leucyl/Isoleucyl-tRNA synthetase anticodon-binding domain-containing protein n=1 Tax=Ktedonobacter robiniae TaxID=2778365 RepID=A0ABQ3UTF9_9CHLR|nr:hypothetical protein [Ktedonobacter robiniae]GHO55862.1 hypothetical protein KSB_43370 [Ktedonobacter robiniae]
MCQLLNQGLALLHSIRTWLPRLSARLFGDFDLEKVTVTSPATIRGKNGVCIHIIATLMHILT